MDKGLVTRDECRAHVDKLSESVNRVTEEVKKQSKALFGDDGRGGMQKDITTIINKLEDGGIRSTLTGMDKIIIALITTLGSIFVAVIANGVLR